MSNPSATEQLMIVNVRMQKQYAMPGRSAMFAWKPFYVASLPLPRTDGRFIQNANSKADLKFFVDRHLRSFGYTGKFQLNFAEVSR